MFGDKLKDLRKEKKLTQKEVANILSVPQQTYSNWENNTREPKIETIKTIAEFYKVSSDYLLEVNLNK